MRSSDSVVSRAKAMYKVEPEEPSFEMYSYEQPNFMFWHAFVNELISRGISDNEIVEIMQSKKVRHMFDRAHRDFDELAKKLCDGLL